jgi:hypothetical protein
MVKSMAYGGRRAAIAALLSLAASGAANAATCTGSCGTGVANGDVANPSGASSYGWVSTFGGADGAGQLAGIGGTNGSSFTTSMFHAQAGQNLSYYFNYISSDGQDGAGQFVFEDYASVQLIDAVTGQAVAVLFDARSEPTGNIVPGAGLPPIDPGVTLTPSSATMKSGSGVNGNLPGGPVWSQLGDYSGWCWGAGCGQTGWIQSNYQVSQTGDYQLAFGVTNWGDTVYDSGLAYSTIMIGEHEIEDAVPEPATWGMMIIGCGAIGAAMRRRRMEAAA